MSHGFSAVNDSGKIIISDDMENLHFVGQATLTGNDGGDYGDFPGYTGTNDTLDGRVIFTFTITTSGVPLAFIKPSDYSRWHSVVKQSQVGNVWTFDILASGTSTANPPSVYCFINADNTIEPSDTHGLVVYKPDGSTRTFDSRISPLAISNGGTTIPPLCPVNDGCPTLTTGHPWNYATLDWDFSSSNKYNSSSINGTNYTDMMFAAPSITQGVYKRQMEGYKCSNNPFWQGGCQDHWSTAIWWVMYRNAFRIRNGYLDAGWGTYAAGYSFSSAHEDGGWFGGGGGSYSSGTMPYTAKTINYFSNAYMVVDSTRYD